MPQAVVLIRKEPFYRRDAFERSLKRLGYTIHDRLRDNIRPESRDDLLVVWNLKQGQSENEARLWEQRGGTLIVSENGYLAKQEKTYYALSVHGHNGAGWFPYDWADDRFSRLGFPLPEAWRQKDTDHYELIVCAQRGVGSSSMASPPAWAEKMAQTLAARVRPHPGNFKPKIALEVDLQHAYAISIWSSACGVRALTLGIPVFYSAPHWICESAARRMNQPQHLPHTDAAHDALRKMAHGQWHFDEIATGEPFARMQAENWGPKWA